MKNFFRMIFALAGIAIGIGFVIMVYEILKIYCGANLNELILSWVNLLIFVVSGLIFGFIFFILSKGIVEKLWIFIKKIEIKISDQPLRTVISAIVGLLVGFLIAYLFSTLVDKIPIVWISVPINILLYVVFGYIGIRIAVKSIERAAKSGKMPRFSKGLGEEKETTEWAGIPKILDTSVIIDGRIFDILRTGIVEGKVVIPEFVLSELRHIADSEDAVKRGKGRRGLDILNRIQRELKIPIEISEKDYDDIQEVDAKLLRLARELNGKVVTNDFNLNKVAIVQGVSVFNINELSNAVKPALVPGEEFSVSVLKEGKENGQGVAYLEDGTMIVVENGKDVIGKQAKVSVTSVLQTPAGRMIFARLVEE